MLVGKEVPNAARFQMFFPCSVCVVGGVLVVVVLSVYAMSCTRRPRAIRRFKDVAATCKQRVMTNNGGV